MTEPPPLGYPQVTSLLGDSDRFPVVFVFAGRLFGGIEGSVAALQQAFSKVHRERHLISISAADVIRPNTLREISDNSGGSTLLILHLESLLQEADRCRALGGLRQEVLEAVDRDCRVILISADPAAAFGGCPGSSLIIDARRSYPEPQQVADLIVRLNGDSRVAQQIVQESSGLPALVEALIASRSLHGSERRQSLGTALLQLMRSAIRECRPDLATMLRYRLSEGLGMDWDLPLEEWDPELLSACRGAGFIIEAEEGLGLVSGRLRSALIDAVVEYCVETLELGNQSSSIWEALWFIERRLRSYVRQLASRSSSHDPSALLVRELVDRCKDRALADSELWGEWDSLADVFEWLTLGELLDVVSQSEWARDGWISRRLLRRIREDIMPIRNRAAHMHLPFFRDHELAWEVARQLEAQSRRQKV